MLKIRLQRIGRRNDPAFRVVVTEHTQGPKSGNYLEFLGSYDPRQDTSNLKTDRIKHWLSQGAQTSDTMHNLLVSEKVIEGKKKNVLPRKSPVVKDSDAAEAAPEEEKSEASSEESTKSASEENETSSEEKPAEASAVEGEQSPSEEEKTEESKDGDAPSAEAKEDKEAPAAESAEVEKKEN